MGDGTLKAIETNPVPQAKTTRQNSLVVRLLLRFATGLSTVLLTFCGLLFVTFAVGRLLPTDPVLAIVGDRASPEVYQHVFEQLRLDRPVYEQFFHYVVDMLGGDFGQSASTGRAVSTDILTFFPATLELATVAIIIGIFAGVPLGLICARYNGRWPDHVGRIFALSGHSIPVFWLGLIALLVFYAKLGWTGGPGKLDITYAYSVPAVTGITLIDTAVSGDAGAFRNAISHIVLPGGILGLMALGYIARMTRTFLLGQMGKDYLITARLKGMTEGQILLYHVLPAVSGPIIAVIAWTYAYMLEGAVLTETVFAWPGLGLYITQSLFSADIGAVLASTLVVGAGFTLLNLFAETIQTLLDPRLRTGR